MNLNSEKLNKISEENKKDNNPLSVRVDAYYKDLFEDVIKQKGLPKKAILEAMILKFVENENESEKELNISFTNEINHISGNLNEILNVIKNITSKSQDTIGSQKSFFEQKINNLEIKNLTLENTYLELKDINEHQETLQKEFLFEKDMYNKSINELNVKFSIKEKETIALQMKNAELAEQNQVYQKLEKENILYKIENEKIKHEVSVLKVSLDSKIVDNDKLMKKIAALEELLAEAKSKKIDEFKELEFIIKKEAEVDKKMEIVKLQAQYNDLQTENLKNLRIINDNAVEISQLKKNFKI